MMVSTSISGEGGKRAMDKVPTEVETVIEFVNTLDVESGSDRLGSPEELTQWLRSRGLLDAAVDAGDDDLELARALREALRAVLRAHHDEVVDRDAIAGLNAAAARLSLGVCFDDRGDPEVVPRDNGVTAALGHVLGATATARATGSWPRLKICSMASCQWAFFDRSKNRSGRWCSMEVCGNRAKTRSYRSRRRSV
jgi:predicted RNA-binding Zn ribbon-like protein